MKRGDAKEEEEARETCPICLEDIDASQVFVQLPCKHHMHDGCYDLYQQNAQLMKRGCPFCARKFAPCHDIVSELVSRRKEICELDSVKMQLKSEIERQSDVRRIQAEEIRMLEEQAASFKLGQRSSCYSMGQRSSCYSTRGGIVSQVFNTRSPSPLPDSGPPHPFDEYVPNDPDHQ